MTFPGTVVNGVIVLEGSTQLPEGARVWIELDQDDDVVPPPEPYDKEKELAILRKAIEDAKVNPGMPLDEFRAHLAKLYKAPPSSAE